MRVKLDLSRAKCIWGGFCSRRCVRILTRVARVNNLALRMRIAASGYCIDFAAMASIPWHLTYKSSADACSTEACDGRIPP